MNGNRLGAVAFGEIPPTTLAASWNFRYWHFSTGRGERRHVCYWEEDKRT
ncbi:MAG: hypothetical protein WBF58_11090 [Xanthobacteraceae bacterium]